MYTGLCENIRTGGRSTPTDILADQWFFGELYRIGASEPVEWMEPETGEVRQCRLSPNYLKCQEIKEKATEDMEEQLKQHGCRMKFPAKTGDLSRRWCSAYLKINGGGHGHEQFKPPG